MSEASTRRDFLKGVTALGAAALPTLADAHGSSTSPGGKALATMPVAEEPAYQFFSAREAAFVEAALASLIPADALGPGAREAGVAHFIDRELAGAFGANARNYRQGPWPQGSPEQGPQWRLTPREIYREAIGATNRHCEAQYGRSFDDLELADREAVLHGLESGSITLEPVPARTFFDLLWSNTQEGFFADPMYGGNRDKIGWSLVGFPGVAAAYVDEIEKHNVPYDVVPVSIGELQRGHVAVDAHGHPVHVRRKPGT